MIPVMMGVVFIQFEMYYTNNEFKMVKQWFKITRLYRDNEGDSVFFFSVEM